MAECDYGSTLGRSVRSTAKHHVIADRGLLLVHGMVCDAGRIEHTLRNCHSLRSLNVLSEIALSKQDIVFCQVVVGLVMSPVPRETNKVVATFWHFFLAEVLPLPFPFRSGHLASPAQWPFWWQTVQGVTALRNLTAVLR